jgi:hypothetical protein
MTYRLIQLAPGSYDLLLGEIIVASVVRSASRKPAVWTAELLEEPPAVRRPVPFTMTEHAFPSFGELCAWLGHPEVKPVRRDASMF